MNACFTCVALKSAKARVDHNVPVWRYRFFGDFPNNRRVDDQGAYHGSELALVYGAPKLKDASDKSTDTPAEAALTKVMMTAWASFAKDPENGLTKLGYPLYKPDRMCCSQAVELQKLIQSLENTLILFGINGGGGATFGSPGQYDVDCARYEASNDAIDVIMGRSIETPVVI
jgi:cholinesterase